MAVAVLFPGQGSQHLGMADPWTTDEVGRAVLKEASEAMGRDVAADCHSESALATTEFVQPALLACDVAAFRALEAEGTTCGAAAGHSLGEFAALVAAGVFDLSSALRVVMTRGCAMQMASEQRPGTMTALIGIDADEAADICDAARQGDVLAVANENAANQFVLSGSIEAIERAEEQATSRGARAIRLKVAGAFHSSLMQPAVDPIRQALARLEFRGPRFPIVANVTGGFVGEPAALREALSRHIVSPVRWHRSMRTLVEAGFDTFAEAGPGRVLTKLVERDFPSVRAVAIGTREDAAVFARTLADEGRS